jgi:hypothetical protein
MQMENKKKFNRDHFILGMILLCGLFVAMTIFGWTRWVSISLCDDILTRHYSREEIVKNNLIIESTRNEIRVSNGDVLPNSEYLIFYGSLWKQTIPIILMWILFFLFVVFVLLINRATTKFLDERMITCQHDIIKGYNNNYNEAIACILSKIKMSNIDQDVYNQFIVELIRNVNKKIFECKSTSTLPDSLSFEDWYDAIIPKSLKQNKAVDSYNTTENI